MAEPGLRAVRCWLEDLQFGVVVWAEMFTHRSIRSGVSCEISYGFLEGKTEYKALFIS